MSNLLSTIWNLLKAPFVDGYTAVVAVYNVLLSEIPNDEIAIMLGAKKVFTDALTANKGWGDAAAETWTYVENQEGAELSKVGNLLLQAFIAKFEPPAAA